MEIGENGAKELVALLVHRGYFHDNQEPVVEHDPQDSEDFMMAIQKEAGNIFSMDDVDCMLVATRDGSFMTRASLRQKLLDSISRNGGRVSRQNLAAESAVTVEQVQRTLVGCEELREVGGDVLSPQFFDEVVPRLYLWLETNGGLMSLSELSHRLDVTFNSLEDAFKSRLGRINARMTTINGATVVINQTYETRHKFRIQGVFCALSEPTMIDTLCQDLGWDVSFVMNVLRELCNEGAVDGMLHDSDGGSGALFTPTVHIHQQRQAVDSLFQSQGYLTARQAKSFGLTESTFVSFVKKSFPGASVLQNAIIDESTIIQPLVALMQEAMDDKTFADLGASLPAVLCESHDVLEEVFGLACCHIPESNPGIAVDCGGDALFVSTGMIDHVSKRLLPPLIEKYAKVQAEKLNATGMQGTKGFKPKRKTKRPMSKGEENVVVPLLAVASAIAREYPSLAAIQSNHESLGDEKQNPQWESLDDEEECNGIGPIYSLCRKALFTDDFQKACAKATQAELRRLARTKSSSSVVNRREGATKIQSVDEAFEDPACFSAACYQLQVTAKYFNYLKQSGVVTEDEYAQHEEEFLTGCCATFAARITQYCLFKNEIEGVSFSFHKETSASDPGVPSYCLPVDYGARQFPIAYVTCVDTESGEHKLPLKVFRKVLPGGIGSTVSKMWMLCGGKCYEGGVEAGSDGSEQVFPGHVDDFLDCVQESCLTICGLPFKKLDKKSEKVFMSARKQLLSAQLEGATDPQEVLELAVMLLLQQTRYLAASGRSFAGPAMKLLEGERKMTQAASDILASLASCVATTAVVGEGLIMSAKSCGLSKDISKLVIEPVLNRDTCP